MISVEQYVLWFFSIWERNRTQLRKWLSQLCSKIYQSDVCWHCTRQVENKWIKTKLHWRKIWVQSFARWCSRNNFVESFVQFTKLFTSGTWPIEQMKSFALPFDRYQLVRSIPLRQAPKWIDSIKSTWMMKRSLLSRRIVCSPPFILHPLLWAWRTTHCLPLTVSSSISQSLWYWSQYISSLLYSNASAPQKRNRDLFTLVPPSLSKYTFLLPGENVSISRFLAHYHLPLFLNVLSIWSMPGS